MKKNAIVNCLLFTTGFISFCSNSGMCSGSDYYSIFKISYDTSTPASRAMDKCVKLLKNDCKTKEIITLFASAFENTGDDPDCYTELCKLAKLCGSSDEQICDEFWAFYGLTETGHKYFRKLSDNIPHSTLIYNLKKAFLSDTK